MGLAACSGRIDPGGDRSGPGAGGGRMGGGAGNTGNPVPEQPTRPPMQRLTRAQYNNTVRDLLGLGGEPAAPFAEDEAVEGFVSNSTLPVQGLQLEQYELAAEGL